MKATREAFGEALLEIGQDPRVVVLDADLSKSTRTELFAKKYPERFVEMGIQESNMIGVAAGLALAGKVPFAASFACFLTGRYDQIRISVAYSKANVRLVGSHAGVGIGEDGYSQQGLEDLALMRALPGMLVLQPADDLECRQMVEYLLHHQGPAYIRTTRQKMPRLHPDGYRFQAGKGVILRDGSDVTLVATGGTVHHALKAADLLAPLSVRVVNISTIKPIDRDLLLQCARETGHLITVEDHTVVGGLGSAVLEAIAERPVRVDRLGLQDVFGESGTPDDLYAHFGLDAAGIARQVKIKMALPVT